MRLCALSPDSVLSYYPHYLKASVYSCGLDVFLLIRCLLSWLICGLAFSSCQFCVFFLPAAKVEKLKSINQLLWRAEVDVENVEDMLARLKAPRTLGGMALAGTVASLNHMVTTQLSTWGGQVRRPEKLLVTLIARALALKVVYVCLVFHTNVCTCGFGYLFFFCGSAQKTANSLNCTCTRVYVCVCVYHSVKVYVWLRTCVVLVCVCDCVPLPV